MSYVKKSLTEGEKIVFRARKHWWFTWFTTFRLLVVLAGCGALVYFHADIALWAVGQLEEAEFWEVEGHQQVYGVSPDVARQMLGGVLIVVALFVALLGVVSLLSYFAYEYAVTTRRVVMRTGLIRRRVFEITLRQLETVSVSQSIRGRLLGFGRISIVGTGGSSATYGQIARPMRFRHAVHTEAQSLYADKGSPAPSADPGADGPGAYTVKGVKRDDGSDVVLTIDADSKANAMVKAELQGVVPTSAAKAGADAKSKAKGKKR